MEDLILQQPTDRRLGDNNTLPPGPPGAEIDTVDFDSKNAPLKLHQLEKENATERSSRRRSPSGSPPPRKRQSPSRGIRSPSPPPRGRGRRSPSPRRNRYRDYSPDRRSRYGGGRRSSDRRRSSPRRGGGGRDRYRGRGRSSSRSISRSPSPHRRGGRWSPKKKPNSPPQQPPPNMSRQLSQPNANQPPPQYCVMAPALQLYGDAYGPQPGYNQYGVPPRQSGFVQPNEAYVSMQAQSTGFNTAYPPPGAWGVDAYSHSQQQWMQPPTQIQQMPPPPSQQQQPPPIVVPPATQQQVPAIYLYIICRDGILPGIYPMYR